MPKITEEVFRLENGTAAIVYGANDENLRFLESRLGARLVARGGEIHLKGEESEVALGLALLEQLKNLAEKGNNITVADITYCLGAVQEGMADDLGQALNQVLQTTVRGRLIKAKTIGQYRYCLLYTSIHIYLPAAA